MDGKRTDRMDGKRTEHPSFGMAQLSRVTARPGVPLFNSPMRHGAFVSLRITRASTERDLSRDWVHPEETVVEVRMSQHQWAELVSSFGLGEGVPCTISRIGREAMPPVPAEGLRETFDGEVAASVAGLADKAAEFRRSLEEALAKPRMLKRDREALLRLAAAIETEIGSNLPFLQAQFEEAMDKTTAVAKSEIAAHADHVARMVGLENIRGQGGQPALEMDSDPPALEGGTESGGR